jgi:hypothetical protein
MSHWCNAEPAIVAIFVTSYLFVIKTNASIKMKKVNILYWAFTGLFGAFMLFSAIPDIIVVPEAVEFVNGKLGYPVYLIPFLGVAKALGVVAIVVPGFPRLKEWAYAGLFFDLAGATYSVLSVEGILPQHAFMILPFSLLALSYWFYHKRKAMSEQTPLPSAAPLAT